MTNPYIWRTHQEWSDEFRRESYIEGFRAAVLAETLKAVVQSGSFNTGLRGQPVTMTETARVAYEALSQLQAEVKSYANP